MRLDKELGVLDVKKTQLHDIFESIEEVHEKLGDRIGDAASSDADPVQELEPVWLLGGHESNEGLQAPFIVDEDQR